nr:hypothetical protein CFP56_62518 [Quercus suber]
MLIVLPGGGFLKGALEDSNGIIQCCYKPEKKTTGTKRRRLIKSGADMALENEAEVVDDDKDAIARRQASVV